MIAKLITVLTIFGSMASIIGLAAIYHGAHSKFAYETINVTFILGLSFSTYVLFVPGNPIAENVAAKVKTYDLEASKGVENVITVQEGDLTIYGEDRLSVRFLVPFFEPPEVELLNESGYASRYLPKVKEVTRYQFIVMRTDGRILSTDPFKWRPDSFKWIATGKVMKEKSNTR